jgi:hypothetical protein
MYYPKEFGAGMTYFLGRPRSSGATDEVLARIDNFEICKAAFERALFVYPKDHLEVRQGARIILKSKED